MWPVEQYEKNLVLLGSDGPHYRLSAQGFLGLIPIT